VTDLKEDAKADWHQFYHSYDAVESVQEPEFLIEGFLQLQAICAIAAPVGQRKTLIALNVVHSLCTGEPLFGRFKVPNVVSKVLYFCPEMGLISFAKRVKSIGLMPCVGKNFFCRTMSSQLPRQLRDMTPDEIAGAVIVLDTAVRFLEGDENSSEHMRYFAEQVFELVQRGALAVIVLAHSQKGTVKSDELTLENCLRGSSELGAFLTSCWATKLQTPDDYYGPSLLKNVKQRDFESKSFEVTSGPDCRLHFVDGSNGAVVKIQSGANRDGKQDMADAIIRVHPGMKGPAIVKELAQAGIERSNNWVCQRRKKLRELDYAELQKNGGELPVKSKKDAKALLCVITAAE
jgi:hypothetical protein